MITYNVIELNLPNWRHTLKKPKPHIGCREWMQQWRSITSCLSATIAFGLSLSTLISIMSSIRKVLSLFNKKTILSPYHSWNRSRTLNFSPKLVTISASFIVYWGSFNRPYLLLLKPSKLIHHKNLWDKAIIKSLFLCLRKMISMESSMNST